MRVKLITDRGGNAQMLGVRPAWRERVLREELQWIEASRYPLFAEVSHESKGPNITVLYYKCAGMRRLDEILQRGVDERLLSSVMVACADVISRCILAKTDAGLLYLDATWIYMGSDGYLRFPYVPIERQPSRKGGVPEGHLVRLLKQLTDQNNAYMSEMASTQAKVLRQLIDRPASSLTIRSLCSVLEGSLSYRLTESTNEAIRLLNSRDPNYIEGPQRDVTARKATPAGTWRGVALRGSQETFRKESGRDSYAPNVQPDPMHATSMGVQQAPSWGESEIATAVSGVMDGGHTGVQGVITVERLSDGSRKQILNGDVVRLGRGTNNEMRVLGNPKISRSHAELRCAAGQISLRDLSSANGTWVDGRRLNPGETVGLPVGRRFSLANEEFIVQRL